MTARQNRILTVVPALVLAAVLAPRRRRGRTTAQRRTTRRKPSRSRRVVTRYEWKNPHVYLWLAAPGADGETVEWEVEGQPPAVLRRVGWSQDTFKVGDRIQATGNPARNAQRKSLLFVSLKRADTTLYDGPSMIERAHHVRCDAEGAVADSIAGVWVTLLDMDAMQAI